MPEKPYTTVQTLHTVHVLCRVCVRTSLSLSNIAPQPYFWYPEPLGFVYVCLLNAEPESLVEC